MYHFLHSKKMLKIIFDDCIGIKMDIMQARFIITYSSLLIFIMIVIENLIEKNSREKFDR